jgi:hypothetical protein
MSKINVKTLPIAVINLVKFPIFVNLTAIGPIWTASRLWADLSFFTESHRSPGTIHVSPICPRSQAKAGTLWSFKFLLPRFFLFRACIKILQLLALLLTLISNSLPSLPTFIHARFQGRTV